MTTSTPQKARWTPWGWSQEEIPIVEGVSFMSTADHGGFLVEGAALEALSQYTRENNWVAKGNGAPSKERVWLEEDCDWSLLIADLGMHPVLGESFMRTFDEKMGGCPDGERTSLELGLMTLKRWHPRHPKMQDLEVLEILERVW